MQIKSEKVGKEKEDSRINKVMQKREKHGEA